MKILVISAIDTTGKIGRQVVQDLLSAAHPVRVLVRQLDGRSHALEAGGAETAIRYLAKPESLITRGQGLAEESQSIARRHLAALTTSPDRTPLERATSTLGPIATPGGGP